jgi:hypothetical protein
VIAKQPIRSLDSMLLKGDARHISPERREPKPPSEHQSLDATPERLLPTRMQKIEALVQLLS